jgi:hypothetical protein
VRPEVLRFQLQEWRVKCAERVLPALCGLVISPNSGFFKFGVATMPSTGNLWIVLTAAALMTPGVAMCGPFQQLKTPRPENTGSYHGQIFVHDGVFINRDEHIVLAINESLSVYETRSGKRLGTYLNDLRGEERHVTNRHEKALQFIGQVGPDFVFLYNHRSAQPTSIRVYRMGDSIARARQGRQGKSHQRSALARRTTRGR